MIRAGDSFAAVRARTAADDRTPGLKWISRVSITDQLIDYFGDYLADGRRTEWERAKHALPLGGSLGGVVALKCAFGVFIDPLVGFPALFRITGLGLPVIKGRDYRLDMPNPGDRLIGEVVGFNDAMRQIDLISARRLENYAPCDDRTEKERQ